MKIILVLCLAALCCLAATPAAAQGRIATVDLNRVFENYWKTRQAQAALRNRAAELDTDHRAKVADLAKSRDNHRALVTASADPAISDSERARKRREAEDAMVSIRGQEEAIARFEAQARATIEEQRRRMRDNLLADIRRVVDSRAKSGGFGLVLDTAGQSAAGAPVVLFTAGDNDLTDAVLGQLNVTAPPEAMITAPPAQDSRENPQPGN